MTAADDTLTAFRFVLDRREAARIAAGHHVSAADDGAFLHAVLSQLFAKSTERVELPFDTFAYDDRYASAMGEPNLLYVVAYSTRSPQEIEDAMGPASETLSRGLDWKRLPTIPAGKRVSFRLRACPVVRSKHTVEGDPARRHKKGRMVSREMDAFIHAVRTAPEGTRLAREDVYCRWLGQQLAKDGAAELERAALVEFRQDSARRHTHPEGSEPRKSERLLRPNAVFEGVLIVKDAQAFRALLARGVGRHRAYGFGMLVIEPSARASES